MRIALTLATGLLALVAITSAFGHAEPARFDPAPGQVLDVSPQRVDGWFTQQMRRSGTDTSIAVYPVMSDGMPGDPVSGETVIDDSNRRHMYAELTGDLMPGQYVVSWSALSDEDDHADSGCYRFFVGQEAADAAAQSGARLDAAEECAMLGGDGMDGSATPSESGPSVSISAPDVIKGGDVTVSLKAEGVEIRLPTNEGQDPAFAHYHLYLDIPPNVTHSHNGSGEPTNPNDIMTTADSHTFKGLKPGNHVVTAVLFYDDHTPFSPAVVSGTSFTVPGTNSGGDDDGIDTGAAIGLAIGIGAAGLVVGGILGFALRRRTR